LTLKFNIINFKTSTSSFIFSRHSISIRFSIVLLLLLVLVAVLVARTVRPGGLSGTVSVSVSVYLVPS